MGDDASEACMNDDVGIMDSDSDEEIEPKSKDKKVGDRYLEIKEKKEEIKPALTGLPMNEASDAWMDDDVGTIDSDSDNESVDSKEKTSSDKNEVEKNQPNLKEKTTEVKSQIAGLPMDDASDAWMNDDVGSIDSDSEQDTDDDNNKESNSNLVQKIQNTKPPFAGLHMKNSSNTWMESDLNCESEDAKKVLGTTKEQVTSKPAGLPMTDASEAWMDDDFGTIESDHEEVFNLSVSDEKKIIEDKLEEFKEKLSGNSLKSGFVGLPCDDLSEAWMNEDFITVEETDNASMPEYDENDRETQMYTAPFNMESGIVKEGRLSAIEEAKRFSCEEEEDEDKLIKGAEIIKEISVCDDDESTSWAYAASKEPTNTDEIPVKTGNAHSPSNPALIVEIIEKEPKHELMDHDGYKVVKGKTKSRDKKKSNEVPESTIKAIIDQLDQPIDAKKHSPLNEKETSSWREEFEIIGKVEENDNIKNPNSGNCVVHQEEQVNSSQDDGDPWLAVKEEYTRKDSTKTKETDTMQDKEYTIEVKVITKETCLGRRLHEQEEKEWKMDVKCMQKNTIPDIIEGHADQSLAPNENMVVSENDSKTDIPKEKSNTLPRLKPKAVSPERLCLSPSWMRKDFSRTQSVESNLGSEGGIFGSVKERKFSDSRTSCFTSSAETLDDDDVYWRLKHKVKKKKRRNQSGPSDAKTRENNELLLGSTNIIESTSPVVNPIIETKEETLLVSKSSITEMDEIQSETSINMNVSNQQTIRKDATTQNAVRNKEVVSSITIEKEKVMSVPTSVAESNIKDKKLVTMEETHLVNTPKLEINIEDSKSGTTPTILLGNVTESKMVGATEIIRATSPMSNKKRPEFKRQNSKEMQNAVEVQRPICFEKQGTLAAEYIEDPWTDDSVGLIDDEEVVNEETKRKSWSSIAATVVSKVSKTKNEKTSHRLTNHKTSVVQVDDELNAEVHKDKEKKGVKATNVEARNSYAGLPTDTMTDAWMNDDVGSIDSDDEVTTKPLALTAPSWADVASKENTTASKEEELPKPPEIVPLKSSKPETMILEAKGEEKVAQDLDIDSEGFKEAVSRKTKKERRISKGISISEEETNDATVKDNEKDLPENIEVLVKYDNKNASEDHLLALTAPSWAGIASKNPDSCKEIPDLPKAPEIVALKHSTSQTQIVDPDEEAATDQGLLDEEGFELSLSRKVNRERKISKRISLSIDEENTEEKNNENIKLEKKAESPNKHPGKDSKMLGSSLPLDDTSEAWMNDEFFTMESDSEDETDQSKETTFKEPIVIQQQRTVTKPSIAGLPMTDASDAWMDDDFGTIDSESETELDESQKIENGRSLCKEEAKTYQQNQEKVNNSNTPTVIGLPMTEASDAWMDDDVLQIESESENESDKTSINADEKEHQLHKTRTNQIGLPMNDEIGTIDSDSEVEIKESHISAQKENVFQQKSPLSLMAPSWAGIASNSPSSSELPDLPKAPELVALKSSTSQTLIVEADDKAAVDDNEVDEEGFELAVSRKSKRERKISKRISLSLDDEENKQDIKIDNSAQNKPKSEVDVKSNLDQCKVDDSIIFKYDMKAIEDAETNYFEFQAKNSKDLDAECAKERKKSKRISHSLDEDDMNDKCKEQKQSLGLPMEENRLIMNLSMDSFWVCKHIFDDAEEKYFSRKKEDTTIIEEVNKNNKKDDEDKDDKDNDDTIKRNKENKKTRTNDSNTYNEDEEIMEYNWTDESTYLSPKIPIIKPVTLKISTPSDNMEIESHLSTKAKRLSDTIENHINEKTKKLDSNAGGDHGWSSRDMMQSLQVDMEKMQEAVVNVDETLQKLTTEEIDGQLAIVQYTLKTLEELESEAISIEARLQKMPSGSDVDMLALSATLTGNRTKLVTLHTQAEAQKGRIDRYMTERRKRIAELKRYQALLVDLEQWLGEAQATISMEIKLTSAKVVRDQIRASESLEQDLRSRSTQLEHLLKEIQKLVGYVDVQPLVTDMTSNLGSLHCVMEDAQQCLEHRLKNLQDILRKMVIGYPEGTDIQKELAASSNNEPSTGITTEPLPDLELIPSVKAEEDWVVVDESLMNVEVDFSSTKAKEFKIKSLSLEVSSLESTTPTDNIKPHIETQKKENVTCTTDTIYDITYVGKLQLNIRQAKELEKKDVFQKADPYVLINFGTFSSKSKKIKNTLNPAWNHEVILDIDKNSPTQIELRLFDWERFGKDEPMGMASISVSEAKSLSKKASSWFDLSEC